MDKEPYLRENNLDIDSMELLFRFLQLCKEVVKKSGACSDTISSCADIVAAVYYYRRYPDVNNFIYKYLKNKENYFQLQWTRDTWARFSKLTETELSELVINQIYSVDNSQG